MRDCTEIQERNWKGRGRPTAIRVAQTTDKGKNQMVNDEGFQQVRNKKNTRRNIFENIEKDLRRPTYEQRVELWRPAEGWTNRQTTIQQDQPYNGAAAPAAALEIRPGDNAG